MAAAVAALTILLWRDEDPCDQGPGQVVLRRSRKKSRMISAHSA